MSATLKTVAERAGVSIRTAGRVLRGQGFVSEKAVLRVRKAAEELAYIPNAAARNLRKASCRIVGVITMCGHSEIAHTRLRVIGEYLRNNSFDMLNGALPSSPEELEKMLSEWTGLVEYVILTGWPTGWDAMILRNFPIRFIFLDCDPGPGHFDRILTDRSCGIRDTINAMIRSGCRNIAHVAGVNTGVTRITGFEEAVRKIQGVHSFRIKSHGVEFMHGYQAGEELVRKKADGVFFDTDRMALGFYRYAHEHQINIPSEIAVAGFDNDTTGAYSIPSLSTVAHPVYETIRKAMEIITARNKEKEPETFCFPTSMILRESILH